MSLGTVANRVGAAATLREVVDFYNLRFQMGLSHQQKADLEVFLRTR